MSEAPVVDPRIGSTLNDRYRIVRRIGVGGMGVVYEGLHLIIQRRVAIKMLHPEYTQNQEILARFRREAIAATTIRHPHIVEVLDMGSAPDGAAYMVLEFLEGRDWSDDIERSGAQSLGKVSRILRQVCDGLQAAHDKNIVHRDLKPENVFLAAHGSNAEFVKIVDFGISKMLDDADTPHPGKAGQNLTKTGAAMGTPYAMAPEQMMGQKDVDHRADLWAIGVMLFRSLTASYPFDADTFPLLAVSVLTGEPQPISKFRSDLPPEIQAMVTRLLSKEKTARYQSAREIRDALAPFESFDDPPKTVAAFAIAATMTPATPNTDAGPASRATAVASPASAQASPAAPSAPLPQTAVGHRVTPSEGTPSTPAPAPEAESRSMNVTGPMNAVPPPPARPSYVTFALGGVVLLALGGAATLAGIYALGTDPAPPRETSVAAPPPSTLIVAAPPATTPVSTVRLQITTTPAHAEVLFDGQSVPNPFDADVPASAEQHTIVARAEGYTDATRTMTLEFPMRVAIDLEHIATGHSHSGGHPTHADPPPSATHVETPVVHVEVAPPTSVAAPPPSTTTEDHHRGLSSPFSH